MSVADLIALQSLFVAVIGGAMGLLWAEVNRLRKRAHAHANEIQILVGVMESKGWIVPRRRNGNGS